MVDIPQSLADLEQNLDDQLKSLELLADRFDEGFSGAARQMAVILRVLLHETSTSKSLLGQLNKLGIEFRDTTFPMRPGQITPYSGFIQWTVSPTGGVYLPLLDSNEHDHKLVDFNTWWESTVLVDAKKNKFSRKQLVLNVADKDGGAHVDPTLPPDYAELSRSNSLGRLYGNNQSWHPFAHPELACIRQISHEILKTLKPGYGKIGTLPPGPLPPILNIHVVIDSEGMPEEWKRTGRNQPCPCGSGKKFKFCHGKPRSSR